MLIDISMFLWKFEEKQDSIDRKAILIPYKWNFRTYLRVIFIASKRSSFASRMQRERTFSSEPTFTLILINTPFWKVDLVQNFSCIFANLEAIFMNELSNSPPIALGTLFFSSFLVFLLKREISESCRTQKILAIQNCQEWTLPLELLRETHRRPNKMTLTHQ